MTKANKKAGTDVAKAAAESAGIKAKGKGKVNKNKVASITKGTTGGGSFQSMIPPDSRLHQSYSNPKTCHPISTRKPSSRSSRNGKDWFRKDFSLSNPSTSFSKWSPFLLFRNQSLSNGSFQRISSSNLESRSEGLRWGLIVGGESLDEQFELISNNPDILIATPGRLLHLCVEMNLNLSSVKHLIFDEADRFIRIGFAEQLTELLSRLPDSSKRQTALFSATLPKSLVEFARAGLGENPKLLRLDSENKVGKDLATGFFSIKPDEKEAALLILLREIIGVPVGGITSLQTIIFCATKHHVEYLLLLLTTAVILVLIFIPLWIKLQEINDGFRTRLRSIFNFEFFCKCFYCITCFERSGEKTQDRYEKSCPEVAKESKRRARSMIKGDLKSLNNRNNDEEDSNDGKVWILAGGEREEEGVSDLIKRPNLYGLGSRDENGRKIKSKSELEEMDLDEDEKLEMKRKEEEELEVLKQRDSLLATINSFRPAQDDDGLDGLKSDEIEDLEQADEDDIETSLELTEEKGQNFRTRFKFEIKGRKDYRDPDFYMDYEQKGAKAERGYNLNEGPGPTNFTTAASSLSFSLTNDDTGTFGTQSQRVNASRWDTKKKKFVRGDGRGRNLNSSRGGRGGSSMRGGGRGGFRHNSFTAPKNLDPKQHDYHKKLKARNEKAAQNDGGYGEGSSSSSRVVEVVVLREEVLLLEVEEVQVEEEA
ncbi:hypothetical protein L7F22_065880 [Adiantum nelumboides]|nr:hypothetical protein [Adiantum nelumboides]